VNKLLAKLFLILLVAVGSTHGQAPTGTIAGVVTDPTRAPVARARITITNRDNRLTRNLNTSDEGEYIAVGLPPGIYRVSVDATGFAQLELPVTVVVGTTTTFNLKLQIGEVSESVTVDQSAPLLHYDQHQVGGVVSRAQIENLPLNGRNFLELAKLEPGVANPVRGTNNRVAVPILGSGGQNNPRIGYTRVTVDGADINFVDSIGAALQVSQEAVQEFQISTVNFDISTSVTSNGAINIVTRSGGNDFHGSGFYFYRDRNLSAYPGLQHEPGNPKPFFQRQQFGYRVGGPIARDHAFFFTSYERNDQRGVLSIQPRAPEFAPLGGIFASPFLGNQFNLRFDVQLTRKHNAFVRYTHDGNILFGPNDGLNNSLPSGWSHLKNWADQSIGGLTSVLSPSVVNDLRVSYFFISSPEEPADALNCAGCFGLGGPRVSIPDVGIMFGTARRLSFVARRYELTENLSWQKDEHRVRIGFDWEHARTSAQMVDQEPATIELYSPRQVRTFNQTASASDRIPLPSSFLTLDNILRLPIRSFQTSAGPGQVLQLNFRKYRITDLYRLYAADTWRISPRLTVNYGLAWSYEPHSLNAGLTRPEFLTAILGAENLNATRAQIGNFAPAVGFAWAATRDAKTVIRGGAGRYFDLVSFNSINLSNERRALFPEGTGRQSREVNLTLTPTAFTGADLMAALPDIRADLTQQLKPDNRDFTFRNLDLNKRGSNFSDPSYETPYALHFNLGVQQELARDLILSADFAWRRFLHTYLPAIDYNHFMRRPQGPVIPRCSVTQRDDLTAVCSSGPITFDSTSGIAQYKGLLMRLEKRLSRRTQFLASYALGSFQGTNGLGGMAFPGTGFNNDNWFESYGPLPTDLRHLANLSGFVELPWRFQLSFSVSAYSRPPFSAYVSGVDFNGDGTPNDLLPGTKVNQFNRGFAKEDLARLVESYNKEFAGKVTAGGQTAPRLTLPSSYGFNDNFFTQDLRVGRTFSLVSERVRLVLIVEVFNLLNTANLVQYSGNLNEPAAFGQPGARSTQVFGSGGPRAFQLGARISF